MTRPARRILETRLSNDWVTTWSPTASDGVGPWSLPLLQPADLVVLDVMMPEAGGYGVCQELRKESTCRCDAQPPSAMWPTGSRASNYGGRPTNVVKPFSPTELEARIRCVLRRVDKEQVVGIPQSG